MYLKILNTRKVKCNTLLTLKNYSNEKERKDKLIKEFSTNLDNKYKIYSDKVSFIRHFQNIATTPNMIQTK